MGFELATSMAVDMRFIHYARILLVIGMCI